MLNLRARKILRDIWAYKARTGLVVLTIAIGVFTVGSLGRVWVILSRNLNDTYLAANPASASLTTARPFNEELVERIEEVPGVEFAEGRSEAFARVQVGPNRWRSIWLISRADFETLTIDIIDPLTGEWPPPRDGVLMERTSMALIPFEAGDTMTVEFSNGQRGELELAGTVHDVTQISSSFSLVSYGYVTPETLERLSGIRSFSTLDITVEENPTDQAHIEKVLDEVSDFMVSNNHLVLSKDVPEPQKHPLDNIMQSVLLLLALLSTLGFLLSVFLVVNIISALLTQQTQQIGAIKAVGGVSSQVLTMYLASVVLMGSIALAFSVPGGIAFSQWTATFFANLINFEIVDKSVLPQNYMLEALAGMIIPNVAALYPVLRAASLTVRETIGSSGGTQASRFGVSGFEKLLSNIPGLPATIMYPFRNVFRRKIRLALAALTLSVAGAILIAVFSVRASFELTVQDISAYWQEDISISFYNAQPISRIERVVSEVPGVERIEARLSVPSFRVRPDDTESTRTIDIFGVTPDSPFLRPQLVEGRWLRSGDTDAVVINLDLMSLEPDLGVGDEIVLSVRGQKTSWTIVGVVTSQVIGGSDLLMSPIVYSNYPELAQVLRQPGRANRFLIGTTHQTPQAYRNVLLGLERQFEQRGIAVSVILLNSETQGALDDAFQILLSLLQIASIVFGAVGGLGLTSMMMLNVLERTREVGIIRSVGGVQGQLAQIVVIEGIFVGLLSWLVAVVLAFPLSIMLGNALGQTLLRTPLNHVFPLSGPLVWLGLVIVLAVISSLLPAHSAARLSIRETLAFE